MFRRISKKFEMRYLMKRLCGERYNWVTAIEPKNWRQILETNVRTCLFWLVLSSISLYCWVPQTRFELFEQISDQFLSLCFLDKVKNEFYRISNSVFSDLIFERLVKSANQTVKLNFFSTNEKRTSFLSPFSENDTSPEHETSPEHDISPEHETIQNMLASLNPYLWQ